MMWIPAECFAGNAMPSTYRRSIEVEKPKAIRIPHRRTDPNSPNDRPCSNCVAARSTDYNRLCSDCAAAKARHNAKNDKLEVLRRMYNAPSGQSSGNATSGNDSGNGRRAAKRKQDGNDRECKPKEVKTKKVHHGQN